VGGAAVRSLGGVPFSEASQPMLDPDQPRGPIFLDHNENAYGPSEKVRAALRDGLSRGNRYPRYEYESLISKIAALHAVGTDQIILGCGSSDVLRQAAATLLGPGKKLVQASPTFPALGMYAQSQGIEVVNVPLNHRHQHDLDAMQAKAGNSAGLIYICNPNNPTATVTPRGDIENFLQKVPASTTVLIDEAYHHFAIPSTNYASFLDRPSQNPRVLVCRTFSTVYGLAGLRIGYAVGAPDVVKQLSPVQLRYGVSTISAVAAAAAIDDGDYIKQAVKRNADDRQEFMNRLNIAMLKALDSHANFVFFDALRPVDIVIDHLKEHGVIVAPLVPAMDKYVRVSLGTPPEMREFWRVMDLLPPTGKMAM
jgi:histidinol-phosphate aminotransferase